VLVAEIGEQHQVRSAPNLTCWAGLTPKHHESDTHVHRGRITKEGSRLVRRAAIESVKNIPAGSVVGLLRERVADRRGRNIGSVAAARRQLEFVFYALRDGHVRALEHQPRVA
jgi:transposase